MDEKFFWLIYPLNMEPDHEHGIYSFSDVLSGNLQIENTNDVVNWAHLPHGALPSNSSTIWYIPEEFRVEKDVRLEADRAFRLIVRVNLGVIVSDLGIIRDKRVLHLPQLQTERSGHPLRSFSPTEIEECLRLAELLFELEEEKQKYFLEIYHYLSEIRYSLDHVKFIGELALWSFIEHYFAYNQLSKTDETRSLEMLLAKAMKSKEEKKAFRHKIEQIGKSLGEPYNQTKLRNILAHGSYITLQEGWTSHNWQAFYTVHEELFLIVAKAIKLEVLKHICPQEHP